MHEGVVGSEGRKKGGGRTAELARQRRRRSGIEGERKKEREKSDRNGEYVSLGPGPVARMNQ